MITTWHLNVMEKDRKFSCVSRFSWSVLGSRNSRHNAKDYHFALGQAMPFCCHPINPEIRQILIQTDRENPSESGLTGLEDEQDSGLAGEMPVVIIGKNWRIIAVIILKIQSSGKT